MHCPGVRWEAAAPAPTFEPNAQQTCLSRLGRMARERCCLREWSVSSPASSSNLFKKSDSSPDTSSDRTATDARRPRGIRLRRWVQAGLHLNRRLLTTYTRAPGGRGSKQNRAQSKGIPGTGKTAVSGHQRVTRGQRMTRNHNIRSAGRVPKSLKFAPNLSRPAGGVQIERFQGDLPQEDLDSDSLRLGLSELNTRERLKDGDRAESRNRPSPSSRSISSTVLSFAANQID